MKLIKDYKKFLLKEGVELPMTSESVDEAYSPSTWGARFEVLDDKQWANFRSQLKFFMGKKINIRGDQEDLLIRFLKNQLSQKEYTDISNI